MLALLTVLLEAFDAAATLDEAAATELDELALAEKLPVMTLVRTRGPVVGIGWYGSLVHVPDAYVVPAVTG